MSTMSNLRKKTITSLLWKGGEKILGQFLILVVTIVLARMLSPDEYGIVAVTTIFISIGLVIIENGLGLAIIQNKNISIHEIDAIMLVNISIGFGLFIVLNLLAHSIALFFNYPQIEAVLRVLSIEFIFGSISSIFVSCLSRDFKFRFISISGILTSILSGAIAILLASQGYGVWAIVIQQLSYRLILFMFLLFASQYRYGNKPDFTRINEFFRFGMRVLFARLLQTMTTEARSLLIGKYFSPSQLAFYSKGHQFPAIIATSTDYAMQQVMFTVYSKEQSDAVKLKSMVRATMIVSTFILFPLLLGMSAVASEIISVLLTEKWLPAVPFMQILCISYVVQPFNTANTQAINAQGRSDLTLRIELISQSITIILVIIACFINPIAIAWTMVFSAVISALIRMYESGKLLNYGIFQQVKDILPSLFAALLMYFVIILAKQQLTCNRELQLIILVFLGIICYASVSVLFKLSGYMKLKEYARKKG